MLYTGFAVVRNRVVAQWVDDAHTVSAIDLALGAGSIIGRVLFLLHGVRNALRVAILLPARTTGLSSTSVAEGL